MNLHDSKTGLQLQLHGVVESEIINWLAQLGIQGSRYAISSQSQASGELLVNLILALQDIKLDVLSLLVGYLLARGIRMSHLISGIARPIRTLEDAARMVRQLDAKEEPKEEEPKKGGSKKEQPKKVKSKKEDLKKEEPKSKTKKS